MSSSRDNYKTRGRAFQGWSRDDMGVSEKRGPFKGYHKGSFKGSIGVLRFY